MKKEILILTGIVLAMAFVFVGSFLAFESKTSNEKVVTAETVNENVLTDIFESL
jgi:hypothetical protein